MKPEQLRRACLLLSFALIPSTGSTGHAQAPPLSATALSAAGLDAFTAKDFKRAGELYQQAVQRGAKSPMRAYDSATGFALAGDRDQAFIMLAKAVAMGFHDPDNLTKDPDLAALRADPR